jgi:hypothetical protein
MRQKAAFHGDHFSTELLQKTDSQHLLRPWLDTSASLMFFGQKWPFSRCLHGGFISTDLKDFYMVSIGIKTISLSTQRMRETRFEK